MSAAMGFFQGTQERVRNNQGKRAISVRAIVVLLYLQDQHDSFNFKEFHIFAVKVKNTLSREATMSFLFASHKNTHLLYTTQGNEQKGPKVVSLCKNEEKNNMQVDVPIHLTQTFF